MPNFDVTQTGADPLGRPILMTAYMAGWWERVCADLGFTPTIVQGAFMVRVGGGAADSAGVHDGAGCLDLRVWDLTDEQVGRLVRTLRRFGAAAWVRDERHGMDPHIHLVLGSDRPLAAGAETQWEDYEDGRDGLASKGRDYHWRPDPLVLTPPPVGPSPRDLMRKDLTAAIRAAKAATDRAVDQGRTRVAKSGARVVEKLRAARRRVPKD